mmetsp:Transcript_93484/g.213773  ORF Transcript_93484/g.213773 Transcript_93484/m.213773 type:complete len:653 (+) Transcript_93484:1186-3144(+)
MRLLLWSYVGRGSLDDMETEAVEMRSGVRCLSVCERWGLFGAGDRTGAVSLHSLSNLQALGDLSAQHQSEVCALSLSGSDNTLLIASAGRDRQIFVSSYPALQRLCVVADHSAAVLGCVLLAQSGRSADDYDFRLMSWSADKYLTFRGLRVEGESVQVSRYFNEIHKGRGSGWVSAAVDTGGDVLVVARSDRQVMSFAVSTGSVRAALLLDKLGDAITALCLLPDTRLVAVSMQSANDRFVGLVDLSSKGAVSLLGKIRSTSDSLQVAGFGAGRLLVAGSDGAVGVWQLRREDGEVFVRSADAADCRRLKGRRTVPTDGRPPLPDTGTVALMDQDDKPQRWPFVPADDLLPKWARSAKATGDELRPTAGKWDRVSQVGAPVTSASQLPVNTSSIAGSRDPSLVSVAVSPAGTPAIPVAHPAEPMLAFEPSARSARRRTSDEKSPTCDDLPALNAEQLLVESVSASSVWAALTTRDSVDGAPGSVHGCSTQGKPAVDSRQQVAPPRENDVPRYAAPDFDCDVVFDTVSPLVTPAGKGVAKSVDRLGNCVASSARERESLPPSGAHQMDAEVVSDLASAAAELATKVKDLVRRTRESGALERPGTAGASVLAGRLLSLVQHVDEARSLLYPPAPALAEFHGDVGQGRSRPRIVE